MNEVSLPIEYHGIQKHLYSTPTIFEQIYNYPEDINIKNISKVYSHIESVENKFFDNLHTVVILCKVNINIEYIEINKNNTINLINNVIYIPITLSPTTSFHTININPIIGDFIVTLLDSNNLYFYIELYPY